MSQDNFLADSRSFSVLWTPPNSETLAHALYLDSYKIQACELASCSDPFCLKAHRGEPLRRRPIRLESGQWSYTAVPCANLQCDKQNCGFAHSVDERLYHPDLFKTTLCSFPVGTDGVCSINGRHCPFAHSETEMRNPSSKKPKLPEIPTEVIDIATYKIYKCPSTACKLKPCAYYHNQYDRRRDPKTHAYCSIPCKNVYDSSRKKFSHPEKCKNGDECKYAHTKFEAYYHPAFYRTQVCSQFSSQGRCDRGSGCAFLHPTTPPSPYPTSMLTQLLQSNQRLVKEHDSLKTQLESLKTTLKTLKRKAICPACKVSGKAVYLSCGHLVCDLCAAALSQQVVHKCPVCSIDVRPLCAMRL